MSLKIAPAPVRKTLQVKASQARAFEVFTAGFARWWPASHSIGKSPLKDAIMEPQVGGRWYERGEDGSECDWGRVLAWEPPARLVLSWQLSAQWKFDPDLRTEVEVRFIPEGDRLTRVEFEHRGLENTATRPRPCARASARPAAGPAFWRLTPQQPPPEPFSPAPSPRYHAAAVREGKRGSAAGHWGRAAHHLLERPPYRGAQGRECRRRASSRRHPRHRMLAQAASPLDLWPRPWPPGPARRHPQYPARSARRPRRPGAPLSECLAEPGLRSAPPRPADPRALASRRLRASPGAAQRQPPLRDLGRDPSLPRRRRGRHLALAAGRAPARREDRRRSGRRRRRAGRPPGGNRRSRGRPLGAADLPRPPAGALRVCHG